MASATTERFDVADHLNSPDEAVIYLEAVLEEGDDRLLLLALRDVVKSKGFAVSPRGPVRDGRPCTLQDVLGELGMRLSVAPLAKSA